MLSGAGGDQAGTARNRPVTNLKDLGWLLLGGLLIPVFMALALVGVVFIVGRHLQLVDPRDTRDVANLARRRQMTP